MNRLPLGATLLAVFAFASLAGADPVNCVNWSTGDFQLGDRCVVNAADEFTLPDNHVLVVGPSGNDNRDTVAAVLYYLTGSVDLFNKLTLLTKSDSPDFAGSGIVAPGWSGAKSGEWNSSGALLDQVDYVTVKAANSFALYAIDATLNHGTWSTDGIVNGGGKQPGASHLSFWDPPPTPQVPEPTTLVLLGSGLLASVRRRRKNAAR